MTETKTCPACGKNMIRRSKDLVLLTYPGKRVWYWWCACGHAEHGGSESPRTEEEIARAEWERVNPP